MISCEKLTSQVDAHLSRLGTEVTKCFAVGQLKKNTSELVRKLACFCSQFSSSILCIPIYYPSTTPVRLDLISLALDCCWRGLNLLYESMAQNSQKVMVDESIVPQGEQPLNGETHIVSLIITHLRRMRLWEGSSSNSDPNRRGRSGDIWHDKIWSHFLHSYFIILNSYYSILAYKIKMDNPSPVMGVGNQNSRQSQLSETQASEFSNSVSLSSQNGGQTKSRKGRRKRKRSIGEVKDGEGYREEKEEDKQSKAPPNQSLLSSFTGLLTEAQEYKVFCRKTRVGPLYEVRLF